MKIFKFILLWITLTVVMLVAWSIGFLAGNGITQSSPPPVTDQGSPALALLMVCLTNSFLLGLLLWKTHQYSGWIRGVALVSFSFVIQFLLPQMESYFFSDSIGIATGQIISILIAGFVMSAVTVSLGMLIVNKMNKSEPRTYFTIAVPEGTRLLPPMILLAGIVYPVIYLVFGYYVAWQNESLRVYYTQSAEIQPFFAQFSSNLFNGIYLFQILRGMIWVIFSIPVILMFQKKQILQYLLVGLLMALLPAMQLFIPNSYMPAEIAMTHFIETSLSNFLWGITMTFILNKYIQKGALQSIPSL